MIQQEKIKKVLCLFCVLFSVGLALPSVAQAARLYFNPQEAVIGTEGEFQVVVNISAEEAVNALAVAIAISPELEPYDASDGNSIINLWLDKPNWDETSRLLTFSGIIPGGFSGKDAPLLILKLRAVSEGEGLLDFDREQTKAYLNTPDGIEDKLELTALRLPVARGKENIPVKPFDSAPPEPFTPVIARDPSVFNNKWFLVFTTQDKGSGVAYYAVHETTQKRTPKESKLPAGQARIDAKGWKAAESPYLLEDQELRSYIFVKAVDKAGNERIAVLPPQKPLVWYEKYLIYVIIIVIVIFIYIIFRLLNNSILSFPRKRESPGRAPRSGAGRSDPQKRE